MREVLKDRLALLALGLVGIAIGLILFVVFSTLPLSMPIVGVMTYSLFPLLFLGGAAIFFLAIQRERG